MGLKWSLGSQINASDNMDWSVLRSSHSPTSTKTGWKLDNTSPRVLLDSLCAASASLFSLCTHPEIQFVPSLAPAYRAVIISREFVPLTLVSGAVRHSTSGQSSEPEKKFSNNEDKESQPRPQCCSCLERRASNEDSISGPVSSIQNRCWDKMALLLSVSSIRVIFIWQFGVCPLLRMEAAPYTEIL